MRCSLQSVALDGDYKSCTTQMISLGSLESAFQINRDAAGRMLVHYDNILLCVLCVLAYFYTVY